MKNIAREYLLLFNAMTDAEEVLKTLQLQLMAAQQQAEALFMEETNNEDLSQPA